MCNFIPLRIIPVENAGNMNIVDRVGPHEDPFCLKSTENYMLWVIAQDFNKLKNRIPQLSLDSSIIWVAFVHISVN